MIYSCDNTSIDKAVSILKNGGIIIYPTDTLYSFGVDATNSKAIKSLNLLKNRHNPLSIILSSSNQIKNYGKLNNESEKLVNRIFPGPFTILIDSIESNLSSLVNESSDYIGIRIPNHSFPIKIVETLGIGSNSFNKCLTNKMVSDKILNDRINANQKYSINSTPTIVINEKKYEGSTDFKNLKKKIDKLI